MIAMTWNALSHSYISVSKNNRDQQSRAGVPAQQQEPARPSCPAYPREHLLDMGDRCLRQDAVTEIEDERPLGKNVEDIVDRAVERCTAGDKRQRIEVALHR